MSERAGWPDRRNYGKLPGSNDANGGERDAGLNPREALKAALEGDTRGSMTIHGLADSAQLIVTQSLINQSRRAGNSEALTGLLSSSWEI